jgi:acyl transferase domain-containing protein/acyl carrier protein
VIKTVLAIQHGVMPMTLHVDMPSPHVDWTAGAVELLTRARPWDTGRPGRPRRAAVSAFGASGTNAHVVLEQAPPAGDHAPAGPDPAASQVVAWPLSARTPEALPRVAGRLLAHVSARPDSDVTAVGHALATTRAQFGHRAVVLGAARPDLLRGLSALASGSRDEGVVTGQVADGLLAFTFAGQGSQRAGMGADLYQELPRFAEAFDGVCSELDQHLPQPVRGIVFAGPGTPRAGLIDHTQYTQPALFALEVALVRLLGHYGVAPGIVAGHSIGEIAAAHIAGVLTLPDAAALVAARARLMQGLAPAGAMVAVGAAEDLVRPMLADLESAVAIAAVNGPESIVLSGDETAVLALAERLRGQGHRIRRLAVSHAFHSPHIDAMLDEFDQVARELTYHPPEIPVVSDVTGQVAGPAEIATPGYWVRHARAAVRFADVVATLEKEGASTALEIGFGDTITALVRDNAQTMTAVPSLRRDQPGPRSLIAALAELHVRGHHVDWSAGCPAPAVPVRLPTYPFEHRRFWLEPVRTADVSALGLGMSGHPLLGAAVPLPDSGGVAFAQRVSVAALPWLADHVVAGTILLPGAALAEMAVRAGDEVGASVVDELVMERPVRLSRAGALDLRVTVGPPDRRGLRSLAVHARDSDQADEWIRHATGFLSEDPVAAADLRDWPPQGAAPVPVDEFYDRQAEAGLELGPAFRGLRAVWTRGSEVFAEVEYPGDDAAGFLLHPAPLDAALQAVGAAGGPDRTAPAIPFTWRSVALHAAGATRLRVRMNRTGREELSLDLADGDGAAVATIGSLAVRPLNPDQLASARPADNLLYGLAWTPVPVPAAGGPAPERIVELTSAPDGDPVRRARQLTRRVLRALQERLASPGGSPLVILTRDARSDPAASAVWGLLRAAQLEHPGEFVVVDTDNASRGLVPAALATGEPQLAVTDGVAAVPRLVRMTPSGERPALDPQGTVLVTGGTGTLGRLVARHLVTEHGVRHLLLTSRSGPGAAGADELRAELTGRGAEVTITRCDVADRAAVTSLMAAVPRGHPLTAIVHTAGVIDDGVITALTPARLDTTFRPKADGAWNLHELTRDMPLAAFVLFSSAAGTLGGPGQGNYAAANGFLDGLACYRRGLGLPAVSVAWGLWDQASTMTRGLDRSGRGQLLLPIPADQGLAALDLALGADAATLVAARISPRALRLGERLPAVMGGLVPQSRPSAGAGEPPAESLGRVLERLPAAQRLARLAGLVREKAAETLGHSGAEAISEDRPFKDLGFDSLAAVDLRNRIAAATGVRLPSTLIFDYPTVVALSEQLRDRLWPASPEEPRERDDIAPARDGTDPADEIAAMSVEHLVAKALGGRARGPSDR